MKKDFLTLQSLAKDELQHLLERARFLKRKVKDGHCPKSLAGKILGLVFEKSSTRTRVSFEAGIFHLGGTAVYLNQEMSQLGRGESHADTAHVLSGYVHGLVVRTFAQDILVDFAKHASIPVINGLTDEHHPCQLMADLMTLEEKFGSLKDLSVAYVGDGNNLARSWLEAAIIFGFDLRIASPQGMMIPEAQEYKLKNILFTHNVSEAVKGVHAINTDTWFSMGQDDSEEKRKKLWPFQVNSNLLKQANEKCVVMHCLPAHRGEEITNEVMDGPQSVIFLEAENRLYSQMAILEFLLG